jgi:hypothetical protein
MKNLFVQLKKVNYQLFTIIYRVKFVFYQSKAAYNMPRHIGQALSLLLQQFVFIVLKQILESYERVKNRPW